VHYEDERVLSSTDPHLITRREVVRRAVGSRTARTPGTGRGRARVVGRRARIEWNVEIHLVEHLPPTIG